MKTTKHQALDAPILGSLDRALNGVASRSAEAHQARLALAACQDLLARAPDDARLYLELAKLLRSAELVPQAKEVLLSAQQRFPKFSAIHAELASLFVNLGNWEKAEACFAVLCRLQPADATAHYNWGVSLQEAARHGEALAAFERAVSLHPGYAVAYFGLGLAYRELGAAESALMAFELASEAAPEDFRYPLERARVMLTLNNPAKALAILDSLLGKRPHLAEVHNVRGVALKNLHRGEEALDAYNKAIRLQPDYADARINRGNLRLLQRKFSEALADFDEVNRIQPGTEGLMGMRLYTGMRLYRWDDFDAKVAALIQAAEAGVFSIQPLAMESFVDDPAIQQKTARAWATKVQRPEATWHREPGARRPGRIRVAYVSRDFRLHPVSYLMAEVFELHDRSNFEVIGINCGPVTSDAMQGRLRHAFDKFFDVEQLPAQRVAELARALDIDVAIDITGFTAGSRTTVFAWRLAPVQILYIGYLGTAGLDFYDYVIADRVTITPDTRPFYDEKVIYLPWYQANDRQRPHPGRHADKRALGLPSDAFVFCSFNSATKLIPAVFDMWVEVLNSVPGSVLWVLSEEAIAEENLRENARTRNLDPSRLVFAKRASRENYLANLATADLFLDTWPYNAGTTASDALWMGLPVVTLKGESFAGRVAASVLTSAGLEDLITTTREDYVALAVRLAQESDLLHHYRERLAKARESAKLFDAPAFTRNLEAALARALEAHEESLDAADIAIG